MICHPFNLSFDDIANLTDLQVFDLIYHKRNEHGEIEPQHKDSVALAVEEGRELTKEEKWVHFNNVCDALRLPMEKRIAIWQQRYNEGPPCSA